MDLLALTPNASTVRLETLIAELKAMDISDKTKQTLLGPWENSWVTFNAYDPSRLALLQKLDVGPLYLRFCA